jgi:hypothetical protein
VEEIYPTENIKGNLQTELSCSLKYIQSNFQEFFEYESKAGYIQKSIAADEI